MVLREDRVGINTSNLNDPNFKLSVNGAIRAKKIKVEVGWADFVFDEGYELRSLEQVEEHIAKKGHLPEIQSEFEVLENGIFLGEMNAKLLQKIEELTLYLIEEHKANKRLQSEIEHLQIEISDLKTK